MKDDRIHSVSREMAKLHVLEEARHVSFAKTYLEEIWPTLDAARSAPPSPVSHRPPSPKVAELTIDPAVYQELGIDGGAETARDNPHHRARITEGLCEAHHIPHCARRDRRHEPHQVGSPRPVA